MLSTIGDYFTTISTGFSWAKLIYTAILVGIVAILVAEIGRVWFDNSLQVGSFEFFDEGENKAADGRSFALQLISHHRTLAYLFSKEAERRRPISASASRSESVSERPQAAQEDTWWPKQNAPIKDPSTAISDLELSVQGINVKEILTRLRQWVTTPNTVDGMVERNDGVVRAVASWPRGPSIAEGDYVNARVLDVDGQASTSATALQLASSLIWAEASRSQQDLAEVPRQDFVDWTDAWLRFLSLRQKASGMDGLEDGDVEKVKLLRAYVTQLLDRGATYPEVRRLRADVLDLLPPSIKTDDDIAQAQLDRVRYAVQTDPIKRRLPADVAAFVSLAEARPAIPVLEDRLTTNVSDTWQSVLQPFADDIVTAARSTGFGRVKFAGQAASLTSFTGFVVAPNVIATVSFGLMPPLTIDELPYTLQTPFIGEFSFAPQSSASGEMENPLKIEKVLFLRQGRQGHFALLSIAGHDASKHPPLKLSKKILSAEELVGRYVFTVGYPFKTAQGPAVFLESLLDGKDGLRRAMPGRVVAYEDFPAVNGGVQPEPAAAPVRRIVSDLSTTTGTSGGPLVDLRTGLVLGVHYGGDWTSSDKVKLAYATALPDLLQQLPPGVQKRMEDGSPAALEEVLGELLKRAERVSPVDERNTMPEPRQ